MSVLKIRTVPDPVLRQKANRVTEIDSSIRRLVTNMIDTLESSEAGVGLAANQVGRALRIVVIHIPDEEILVLINPEIVEKKGTREVTEGCLSIPGYQAQVMRSESVKVKAKDRNGKPIRVKGKDLLAQALEHEIDHLNGILYTDYVENPDNLVPI